MFTLSWLHLIVLILAAFRLTHLLVFDEITAFIRRPFLTVHEETDENGQTTHFAMPKGTGIRHFIGSLLRCFWCTGVWVSAGVVALYALVPAAFPLLLVFAIAGAAAILETRV